MVGEAGITLVRRPALPEISGNAWLIAIARCRHQFETEVGLISRQLLQSQSQHPRPILSPGTIPDAVSLAMTGKNKTLRKINSTATGDASLRVCYPSEHNEPAPYSRERHLRRLIPLEPENLADVGLAGTLRIVAQLRRALRAERNRGKAGHWSYDLNRHLSLVAAIKAETVSLQRQRRQHRGPGMNQAIAK